jgi:hypothetical protein
VPLSTSEFIERLTLIMEETMVQVNTQGKNPTFPYLLEDLQYWVVKRKDGGIVKFVVDEGIKCLPSGSAVATAKTCGYYNASGTKSAEASASTFTASSVCYHDPHNPIYQGKDVALFCADDTGQLKYGKQFDYVIDCGDVIKFTNSDFFPKALLTGDTRLVKALDKYRINTAPPPKVLKIDWWDRCAPDLDPEFWVALSKELKGDVSINCQGGHGRTGTAFVCLLMVYEPTYDPLTAITHLRAVHCARAIESKIQHEYINDVAKFLGREPNALEVEKVKSYKDAFNASKLPALVKQRELLVKAK